MYSCRVESKISEKVGQAGRFSVVVFIQTVTLKKRQSVNDQIDSAGIISNVHSAA